MSQSSRQRPLFWLPVLVLLAAVQACDCGSTGVDVRRYACTQDDECATGFVCRHGECRLEDGPVEEPDGGTPDGGGTDGGPDAGLPDGGTTHTPTQLTFLTSPQTVVAGQCSGEVTVETQDAAGKPLPPAAQTSIALQASPSTGFEFFTNASCTSKALTLTLQAGESRATFYFRGTVAQSVQLTVASAGLMPVSQPQLITAAVPTHLAFATPAQSLPPGGCSATVQLELRDAYSNPSPLSTQTRVGLGAEDGSGFSFFSDSGCTTAISEVVIAPGTSKASFYFHGWTRGTFSLFASPQGFPTASQRETILPVVRTGTCIIPAAKDTVKCLISPPQADKNKTLLLFQASSNDNAPDTASVRCSLSDEDEITCRRNDGDESSDPAVQIQWQTAELASGLKVQHLQAACARAPLTQLPIQPVSSPQNAFLLVSSEQDGSTQGDDDYYTAALFQSGGDSHVDLQFASACHSSWVASVQVVEFEGGNVTRGLTGSMTGTQLVISDLPAVDPSTTALLFTYRTAGASGPKMCDRVLRGELTSPTSLTFSRGAGNASCVGPTIEAISWERIEFGSRASAQHLQVTMDAATQTVTLPIIAVDPTRTLVFASGQMQSGQAGGETSYAADDIVGTSLGWHALTAPTSLSVTRGATGGTAQWFSTVLQLEP